MKRKIRIGKIFMEGNLLLSKFIVIVIVIAILFTLTSCGDVRGISKEKFTENEYILDENAVVYDIGYESETICSSEKELSILEQMELQIENEYLALYIGKYFDIAILDKQTNKVFFSNRGAYMYSEDEKSKLSDETKKILYSQITIEYVDPNQRFFTMSSYPDCFQQENQVIVTKENDQLLVKYIFGSRIEDKLIVPAFTVETYQHYDNIMKEKIEKGEMNLIEYSYFVNNYELVSYEKLSFTEKALYKEKYPLIEKLGQIYVLKGNLSFVTERRLIEVSKKLGITEEVIKQEAEAVGGVEYLNVTPYFEIPVVYKLHGRDLVVSIDTKNIEYAEGFYLTRIYLLQSFGATYPNEEGYLFVPEGSGMIIYNDTYSYKDVSIEIPFYGPDFAINYRDLNNIGYDNVFPVFGSKINDCAVFAIVENGESLGGVKATIAGAHSDYNTIGPYFQYFKYDAFNREGIALAFSGVTPVVPFVVRYHFLYGKDANYSGMARYYQRYLEQRGMLKKKATSGKIPIDIEFIGTITKKVKVMGIPVNKNIAVTTFEQAYEILELLKNRGVEKISILFSGILNGGLDFKSPAKVDVENAMGGVERYREFISSVEESGNRVFTNIDITKVYKKGNGIFRREDISRFLNRSSAIMTSYSPLDNTRTRERIAFLVNPLKYDYIIGSFVKNYAIVNHKDIYLSSVGKYLNSNFDVENELTREEVKVLTIRQLERLVENGYKLKMDGGNVYVLKYADSVTNVNLYSSNTRLEGQSVPFVGMVLKGYLDFTGESLNQARDYKKAILKTIESGGGLRYTLMYAEPLVLSDTKYTEFYSISVDRWLDEIVSTYKRINSDLGHLSDKRIVEHEQIKENVFRITYENGTRVYVNYGADSEVIDGIKINAIDYVVVQ